MRWQISIRTVIAHKEDEAQSRIRRLNRPIFPRIADSASVERVEEQLGVSRVESEVGGAFALTEQLCIARRQRILRCTGGDEFDSRAIREFDVNVANTIFMKPAGLECESEPTVSLRRPSPAARKARGSQPGYSTERLGRLRIISSRPARTNRILRSKAQASPRPMRRKELSVTR